MATLNENIARVKADFRAIKGELVNKGASIPSGTPTSQYANIIKDMSTGNSEEAYEQGRQDVISKSKYIPKTATGKVISLTDVSEVAHKVKVYGDNQEVEVYGKNLFDISADTRLTEQADGSYINNERILNNKTPFTLPYGIYAISYDIMSPSGKNARMTFALGDGTMVDTYHASTGEFIHVEKTIIGEIVNWYFSYASSPLQGELAIKNVQIEAGNVATPHEPYTHQTVTATPLGTEIDSMCPNMNFIADSDITVYYYSSFGMAEKELAMWNGFTANGARGNYNYGFSSCDFSGYTIPEGLCRPKSTLSYTFYSYRGTELPKGIDCSDFSASSANSQCYYTFAVASNVKKIHDIGIPTGLTYTNTYYACSALEEIEIIRCDENTVFNTNCFQNDSKLTHVIFSGVIASDINLQWSPLLDEESLVSLAMSLAHLIETGENPEGSNIPDGLQFTKTVTLAPESWAILDNTLYPGTGISCSQFITTVKGWNKA